MIRYRPFRNSDPPALAEIWGSQPPRRALAQPLTAAMLERHVFSKTYFDRHGLLVAVEGDRPVGFAHAGFGPTDDGGTLSTELGVTCLVLVAPHEQRDAIARELLAQSEEYLRRRGARVLYAGQIFPLNPFYLGLYGGSELPGVLASDASFLDLLRSAGYEEIDGVVVLQRRLDDFRPVVDRRQMQLRRGYEVDIDPDPPANNWWDASTYGLTHRTQLTLRPKDSLARAGQAAWWDIEPLASHWGVRAAGVIQLEIEPALRRQGLATFLVGELLRRVQEEGCTLAEVQTMRGNAAAVGLYQKLGFREVDRGLVLRKRA